MKHCLFLFLVISTIGTSSISTPLIHQSDLIIDQMDVVIASNYRLITEIESYGVDTSNLNKDFNEILSIYSEAKYYESINEEEILWDLNELFNEKIVKFENDLYEIYHKSISDYDLYKNNLLYKTIILDMVGVIILIAFWNLIIRLYFNKIKKYGVVIKE